MATGMHRLEYEVVEGWERLPEGWAFTEVAGVAVDSHDRVYVFCRGRHPVIVFDREGRFLDAWGEGRFVRPHGIFVSADDRVFLVDDQGHTVYEFALDGRLLRRLGDGRPSDTGYVPGRAPVQRAAGPFNTVTNVAVTPPARSTPPTATATPVSTGSPRTGRSWPPGGSRGAARAGSTCPTGSPWTARGGSTSPTGRTAGSRSSGRTARSAASGTGRTAPASARLPQLVSAFPDRLVCRPSLRENWLGA